MLVIVLLGLFLGNVRAALTVALVLPLAALITFILGQIACWLAMLVGIAGNLILIPLVALVAIAAITASILLLKSIFTR